MPIPIRPVNDFALTPQDQPDRGQFMIDLDTLSRAVSFDPAPTKKASSMPEASDFDADSLFALWQEVEIESNDAEFDIPEKFSQSDVLRLKASGLIAGDLHVVKLTPAGKGIIRALVLSEENSYAKKSVRKPYSQIMADHKRATRGSPMLAVASVNSANLATAPTYLKIEEAQQKPRNVLPRGQSPDGVRDAEYLDSTLLHFRAGTSDKVVLVRVYDLEEGNFATVAWTGRRGGNLTAQTKYEGRSSTQAHMVADQMVSAERRRDYEPISDVYANRDTYGVPRGSSQAPEAAPVAPEVAPEPEPVQQTPAQRVPGNAAFDVDVDRFLDNAGGGMDAQVFEDDDTYQ